MLSLSLSDTPRILRGSSRDPPWSGQAKDTIGRGGRRGKREVGGTWINHAFRPHRAQHKHTHTKQPATPTWWQKMHLMYTNACMCSMQCICHTHHSASKLCSFPFISHREKKWDSSLGMGQENERGRTLMLSPKLLLRRYTYTKTHSWMSESGRQGKLMLTEVML